MSLALALLLLQDPIADLDHDDPAVRAAAVHELRERGECAETNLRSALAAGTTPEAGGRIRELLERIELRRRVAAFPGGPEVDGLRCAVTIGGGPHDGRREVRVEILNVGATDREIAVIRSWATRFPGRSSRSFGNEAELSVTDGPPVFGGRHSMMLGCGGRPRLELASLRPTESRVYTYSLDAASLPSGRYRVSVRYLALGVLRAGTPDLCSNAADVDVGSPDATVR